MNDWKPISDLDRSVMQFLLCHEDGAQRTMLWNPKGFWEHPNQCGVPAIYFPSHFMVLPQNPPTEGYR